MSKKLLIIRHAKSDWHTNLPDFDRPLNTRGQRDAPEMATRLNQNKLVPQHLISSPAKRAITTAGYFALEMGMQLDQIQHEAEIYEASTQTLLNVINEKIDNDYDFVAIFGHNPGLSTLATILCDDQIIELPTCGMVLVEFPFEDWKMVSAGTGYLKLFDYPKNT